MNSTTNLRTTNPRGRPNPLAELSIDYPSAHRQMAVPRFGLGDLSPNPRLLCPTNVTHVAGRRREPGYSNSRAWVLAQQSSEQAFLGGQCDIQGHPRPCHSLAAAVR